MQQVSRTKAFGGWLIKFQHESSSTKCTMKFNVFVPAVESSADKKLLPAVIFLSGLTCTEDNFMQKASALKHASKLKLIIVTPDTSPRGVEIEGQDASWDFGSGAGFYLDATKDSWSKHYQMETYVVQELPALLKSIETIPIDMEHISISGHSMGGHGALTLFCKYPKMYKSVSAFAPICNPINCAWGKKAFAGYLKSDNEWSEHDATELVKKCNTRSEILIDQGSADQFWKDGQLLPEAFVEACSRNKNVNLEYRLQEGYDHSFFFISTFIRDHLNFHAKHLLK